LRTISDFRELDKRIVRKPYPIPKISTTLQELEGFTYATALDLNMGYYTIRFDPTAAKMCTIIFPWGKYSYQNCQSDFLDWLTFSKQKWGPYGYSGVCKGIH
jgi:hypothetical protein